MTDRMPIHQLARKALSANDTQREAVARCLKQLDALDAAWEENERQGGGVIALTGLQQDYCRMAGVPLIEPPDDFGEKWGW